MKLINAFARFVFLVIAVSAVSVSAVAQEAQVKEKDVPAAVKAAFKSAYPNATIRGYAREKENGKTFYEIESKEGDKTRDVLYNPDGTVAEIEESVTATELPAVAQEAIHAKYPKAVITKAEKVTVGSKVGYEISAKQGKTRISFEFDSEGKVVKSSAK